MGEHPPLLTPQGPGVPRARRPGLPRVEDSRTSRVPSSFPDSLGIAPLFAVSASRLGSHHFFPRLDTGSSTGLPALVTLAFPSASFPFLPLPCVQFSPVLSTSFPTSATQVFSIPPTRAYLRSFSLALPFLPLPCVQFSPVPPISLLLRLHAHRRSGSIPDLLSDFGSTAPVSGLGFCGPRVAPKRPRTTPPERQCLQASDRHINVS